MIKYLFPPPDRGWVEETNIDLFITLFGNLLECVVKLIFNSFLKQKK